jgi:hypothetical protein
MASKRFTAEIARAVSAKCLSSGDARRNAMAWTTPQLVEVCAGLEINGYLPPEF